MNTLYSLGTVSSGVARIVCFSSSLGSGSLIKDNICASPMQAGMTKPLLNERRRDQSQAVSATAGGQDLSKPMKANRSSWNSLSAWNSLALGIPGG